MRVKSAPGSRSANARQTSSVNLPRDDGEPADVADWRYRRTSFAINELAKPESYVPGRTCFGNLSAVAELRPLEMLTASRTVARSRSSAAAKATASLVATRAVADRKLL